MITISSIAYMIAEGIAARAVKDKRMPQAADLPASNNARHQGQCHTFDEVVGGNQEQTGLRKRSERPSHVS